MKLHPRHKLRAAASNELLAFVIRLQDSGLSRSEIMCALSKQLMAMLSDSQSPPKQRKSL